MTELLNELPKSYNFSQSSLQDYVDCARRFQLRHINHLQWPAVETAPVLENERRQLQGQLFHRMIQQHLLGLPAEKLARMAKTPELARWWENYLAHGPRLDDFSKFYTEVSLSAAAGGQRILAQYDLVAIKSGQAVIYDWKTYQKRPKDEWMAARLQTRVYRALLAEAGAHLTGGTSIPPEQIEMVYWYADFPTEPTRISYDAARHKREWAGLLKLVAEIAAKRSFPLTEDEKKCAYCQFRSYCDRGLRAGELQDQEEAEAAVDIALEQIQEIEF